MTELREMAQAIYDALLAYAAALPADKALAWASGLRGDVRYHWSEPTREAVNRARADGMSWRAIAMASEGTDDPATVAQVTSKQKWRNDAHRDFHAGVGEFNGPRSGGMPSV